MIDESKILISDMFPDYLIVLKPKIEIAIYSALKAAQWSRDLPRFDIPDVHVVGNSGDFEIKGNYSYVCMPLAKLAKKSPIDIGNIIKEKLPDNIKGIGKVEVVHPGYLNFFHDEQALHDTINKLIEVGEIWERSSTG